MTMNPLAHLTIDQYAKQIGKSPRRAADDVRAGLAPGAFKDEAGRWLIPIDPPASAVVSIVRPRTDVSSHPSQVRRALDYNAMPSYLTIDQAAQLLGISRHAIMQRKEKYDLDTVGENGSWMMPLATIKRVRGDG